MFGVDPNPDVDLRSLLHFPYYNEIRLDTIYCYSLEVAKALLRDNAAAWRSLRSLSTFWAQLLFFWPSLSRIQRDFRKKENCRSDHYSG